MYIKIIEFSLTKMVRYDPAQNIVNIQTVQIGPIRTLVTALKDILVETNIVFTPDGIKIINMDKSHTILAHLKLEAPQFETYECKNDKIVIGVNMLHLFKLINTIDNDDTLTLYIEKNDYTDGVVHFLGLMFDNGDIKQQKFQKLRLIEPDTEELEVPEVNFSSVINMPSSDFQKIIRDLSCISDTLEIRSIIGNEGAELEFRCSGAFAEASVRRTESDGNMEYVTRQNGSKILQGRFSLKNLGYFIKCTNLCNQIEMYLDNDLPLVVKYHVASLGHVKLCLAPLPSSRGVNATL
jgi:proliferating cell nuclear antigen